MDHKTYYKAHTVFYATLLLYIGLLMKNPTHKGVCGRGMLLLRSKILIERRAGNN